MKFKINSIVGVYIETSNDWKYLYGKILSVYSPAKYMVEYVDNGITKRAVINEENLSELSYVPTKL